MQSNVFTLTVALSDIYSMEFSSLLQLGRTPLHYASEEGHHDTVQVLLEYHADVNARDRVGPYNDMCISLITESLPTTLEGKAHPSTMGLKP